MVQTCSKCSRANPEEAVYCYNDGFVLGGGGQAGGPIAIGTQPFGSPFVFPSGKSCGNFNELALTCQEEWDTAKTLLEEGYLEKFLGGLGRIDLAMAAKEAKDFPDKDMGLNELLEKFPTDVLAPPTLFVETTEVNLGTIAVGDSRNFEIHLENRGMRLLHGTVSLAEGVWLSLGDKPGVPEKHFQFGSDSKIKVMVVGDRLRAGNKPLEAKLSVSSNGGDQTIVVKAEVPVKPYPDGLFAGANSPREVALKAKAKPKEAAPLFEAGTVHDWYKSNGWTYPVEGPPASGMGAIQQFFEALGLVKAPKVSISDKEIQFSGEPGGTLSHTVKVGTSEKKHIYAHAVSDKPWLEVSRAKLGGRSATINVSVPRIPDEPGETLIANLRVHANGNQKITIPVHLQVSGEKRPSAPGSAPFVDVAPVEVEPGGAPVGPQDDFAFMDQPAAPVSPEPTPISPLSEAAGEAPAVVPPRLRRGKSGEGSFGMHLIPAGVLALAVLVVVILDIWTRDPAQANQNGEPTPPGGNIGTAWDYDPSGLASSEPLLQLQFGPELRFGIEMTQETTKLPNGEELKKKLTRESTGGTNNTIVKIDGSPFYFGRRYSNMTSWIDRKTKKRLQPSHRKGYVSGWRFDNQKIDIHQHVEIVPGNTGFLDTCLVYYKLENKSEVSHKVGLRVMLDTFIGTNDGVPFTIPGDDDFLTTTKTFDEKDIPSYVEVIENPDNIKDLGTTVRLGLADITLPGIDVEPMEKVIIGRWQSSNVSWDIPAQPMKDDSAVAMYWQYREMQPGEIRHLAFTYGLSKVDIKGVPGGTPIALSAPSNVAPDKEFILTAYVWNASRNQEVTLELPSGVSLASGESKTKKIKKSGNRATVSWRVKAGSIGNYRFRAKSNKSQSKPYEVRVKSTSIFG